MGLRQPGHHLLPGPHPVASALLRVTLSFSGQGAPKGHRGTQGAAGPLGGGVGMSSPCRGSAHNLPPPACRHASPQRWAFGSPLFHPWPLRAPRRTGVAEPECRPSTAGASPSHLLPPGTLLRLSEGLFSHFTCQLVDSGGMVGCLLSNVCPEWEGLQLRRPLPGDGCPSPGHPCRGAVTAARQDPEPSSS